MEFKRDRCRLFYEHWDALRGGLPYPSLSTFRDNANPIFAPFTYIVDKVGDGLLTRLFGTQLVESRGVDVTGKSYVIDQPKDIAHAIVSNVTQIITQPCGARAMNAFSSTKGRKYVSEVVALPLGEDEISTQAAGINDIHDMIGYNETVSGWQGAQEMEWIDIGFGVPGPAPLYR